MKKLLKIQFRFVINSNVGWIKSGVESMSRFRKIKARPIIDSAAFPINKINDVMFKKTENNQRK